jgi:hypothetical protein
VKCSGKFALMSTRANARVAKGDTMFVFASENEGGSGPVASGVVTSARAIAKKRGIAR